MSVLNAVPSTVTMADTEVLPLGIDCTALLESGQSVAAITTTLTNLSTGLPVTLADSPTLTGNIVTQIIRGATDLVDGQTYLLSLNFNASPSINVWTVRLTIICS